MNRIKLILPLLAVLFSYSISYSETVLKNKQIPVINRILEMQDNKNRYNEAVDIINYIDDVYGNIYDTVEKGGKINLYFGPAHGKDDSERWRGITTNRVGITGLPEEYYSILYSRKLYTMLSKKPVSEYCREG